MPFDNFGETNYRFYYTKDQLVSLHIEYNPFVSKFYEIKNIEALFEKKLTNQVRVFQTSHSYGKINQGVQE